MGLLKFYRFSQVSKTVLEIKCDRIARERFPTLPFTETLREKSTRVWDSFMSLWQKGNLNLS
jgi:hypothetical protein